MADKEPQDKKPEIRKPAPQQAEGSQPEVRKPEVKQPEVRKPEVKQPEARQPSARRQTETGKQPPKKAPIALISLGLMAAAILTMVILCLVPGAGKSSKNPILAIYGAEGNIPTLAFTNTLHAAGFEYEVLDYGRDLPSGNNIVVMGIGDESLRLINEYKDQENVAGFILVGPSVNEAYLEGITGGNPECDIAIFAGRDNSTSQGEMGDARIIYERISGDDTIFGIPVRRGGLFASKVFVSNSQNRTLSLSCFSVKDPAKLLFSPLFQNELAGYLSVTYIDEATRETSFGRINSWFVFSWIAIALAALSVILYLSNMPLSVTGNDTKKAPVNRWVFGVIGGTSIALAIGIVASTFVGALSSAMIVIIPLLPLVFMITLFAFNFSWITTKDGRFIPSKAGLIPSVFMAVIIGIIMMLVIALTTDLKVYKVADPGLSSGLLAFLLVIDTIVTTGLIYASRKSSTAGEGAKNCFGNRRIIALMFIPCVTAMVFGLLPSQSGIFYCGLAGLAATGLPYIAVMPLVRHTDRSLVPGILHGIIYTLVLAAIL